MSQLLNDLKNSKADGLSQKNFSQSYLKNLAMKIYII